MQLLNGASPPAVTADLLEGLNVDEYFRTSKAGGLSFLSDALGSTLALVNSAGGVTASYSYTPFGKTTIAGSNSTFFQFTGRENDGTGLYYYRARYYNPTYQRFIAQDPIGFVGRSFNLFDFVGNDPLNFVDPYGLLRFTIYGHTVDVDASITFLNINVSWDLEGFSANDFSLNGVLGISVGGGVDIGIDRPRGDNYASPFVGSRNLSVGTNVILNPDGTFRAQGLNLSIGYSEGLPFGVEFPDAYSVAPGMWPPS